MERLSEYVWSRVLYSLGVNGFLMLRDRGNMGHVLVENVLVLAPNPNMGRLRMFWYECAMPFRSSRYSFGLTGLVECMQVLSSKVKFPRLKSIVTGDVPGFVDVVRNFDTTQLGNFISHVLELSISKESSFS